jgi:hypothetical protein
LLQAADSTILTPLLGGAMVKNRAAPLECRSASNI